MMTTLVLGVSLLVAVGLRWAAVPTVRTPVFDDVMSYETATGHAAEYSALLQTKAPPFGRWATAADWQRLWAIEDRFCFRRIAHGLAVSDIHPPLYFWLLHLWLLAFGVHARTGPLLNLPAAAITVLLVWALARELRLGRAGAAAATLVWAVSPAVLATFVFTRQYELLATLGAGFTWLVLRATDPRRAISTPRLVALALIAAAGLLTQYHFALLIAAAVVAAAWRLRDAPRRRLFALVGAIAAGAGGHLLVYPHLLRSVQRAGAMGPDFAWAGVPSRFFRSAQSLLDFAGAGASRWIWVVAAIAAAASVMVRARGGAGPRREAAADGGATAALLVFLLVLGSATVGLYVAFETPVHAMGPRHLSLIWPLLAVAVTALLWRTHPGRWFACALCIAMLAGGLRWWRREAADDGDIFGLASGAGESLLIDNAGRGTLPPVLWHLPPATRVFAASQARLLERESEWLDALGDRAVYAAVFEKNNAAGARQQLLERIATRYVATPAGRIGQRTTRFELRRIEPEARSLAKAP
jgi:hypothetical protein